MVPKIELLDPVRGANSDFEDCAEINNALPPTGKATTEWLPGPALDGWLE